MIDPITKYLLEDSNVDCGESTFKVRPPEGKKYNNVASRIIRCSNSGWSDTLKYNRSKCKEKGWKQEKCLIQAMVDTYNKHEYWVDHYLKSDCEFDINPAKCGKLVDAHIKSLYLKMVKEREKLKKLKYRLTRGSYKEGHTIMIDPITKLILNEQMDRNERINFEAKVEYYLFYARGFPEGKKNKQRYRKEQSECKRKVKILDKQGKDKESHRLDWECEAKALDRYINTATKIVTQKGPAYCNKFSSEPEKKRICIEYIKFAIRQHKHELDNYKRSMKIEFQNR